MHKASGGARESSAWAIDGNPQTEHTVGWTGLQRHARRVNVEDLAGVENPVPTPVGEVSQPLRSGPGRLQMQEEEANGGRVVALATEQRDPRGADRRDHPIPGGRAFERP